MSDFMDQEECQLIRKGIADHILEGLDLIFENAGMTMEKIAEERFAELNAVSIKNIKMKGVLVDEDLPEGYRQVAVTQTAFGDFETLLELTTPDFQTRQKAASDIEKIRGWTIKDKSEEDEKGGVIIEIVSNVPEPLPLPKYFAEKKDLDQETS